MALRIESIGLMLALSVLLAIQHSTCSPIENEKLNGLKIQTSNLQIKLGDLEEKEVENEVKISEQEKEIILLKAKMDAKLESIQSTELRPNKDNKIGEIKRKESSPGDYSTKSLVPSSCRELFLIGHNLDGLYLVQNLNTKKVETVFCSFGTSVSEALIGNVDVKTSNVHFYVQRNSSFSSTDAVITFELARLNEGGAFDLTSGLFTAPVKGTYHFDFSAIKSLTDSHLAIHLQVNGANVGRVVTYTSATESNNVVSLSASLRLAAGDKVNMFLNPNSGSLMDNTYDHFTNFSGWLIEEDLM